MSAEGDQSGAAGTITRNTSPARTAKWIPCQTAGPTPMRPAAPVYCATKVEV